MLREQFEFAQKSLSSRKAITLPQCSDQLWIVTDGSVTKRGIGATLYINRDGKVSLAGFFSAKLRKHQVLWLPCEIEALSIAASVKHFSPFIIQSKLQANVLTVNHACRALKNYVVQLNISIEIGRVKNQNQNPVADKAIAELEDELLREERDHSPLSENTLVIATTRLNSRLRQRGLSSRELWTKEQKAINELTKSVFEIKNAVLHKTADPIAPIAPPQLRNNKRGQSPNTFYDSVSEEESERDYESSQEDMAEEPPQKRIKVTMKMSKMGKIQKGPDTTRSEETLQQERKGESGPLEMDTHFNSNFRNQKVDRKFLRFTWKGQLYQFTAMPNGLSPAPRIFTKLLKPVLSSLRKEGYVNCAYIDDILLVGDTYEECLNNVQETMKLFDSLGFTIHKEKSVFVPAQNIEFLGFIIDSMSMVVKLAPKKVANIVELCRTLLRKCFVTIREFAQLIGKLVASEHSVLYAPVFYKTLEIHKDVELKLNKVSFDAKIILSNESKQCINWWIESIHDSYKPIVFKPPDRKIESGSSILG
ncbi:unnamed protein product [Mytilus edulis]|uniref:Reverse transcriptase domain-containing protein n=1 Tax=Mytilus edulis TaxID=6550 RepID=A0A8S3U0S7_MYTED|nr:unnamed protein product [Mytilus edulis]